MSSGTGAGAGDVVEEARALRRSGRLADALALLRDAARLDPLNPALWDETGRTAIEAGDFAFAARMLSAAVRFAPNDALIWNNLAFALFRLGHYDDSAAAYARAAASRPGHVATLVALGNVRYMIGDRDGAAAAHDAALAADTSDPVALGARGLVRILRGDYATGWREYDARWGDAERVRRARWRPSPDSLWDGRTPIDRDLCVVVEGGFGDTLLFARYFPLLAEACGRPVLVAAQPQAQRLLEAMPSVARFVPDPSALEGSAWFADAWRLPELLAPSAGWVPARRAYLPVPENGPTLPTAPDGELRAALVWAGNPGAVHDRDRSAPSAQVFAPLLRVPGVRWHSLQVGARAGEVDALSTAAGVTVQPCPPVADFADTAHILGQLDVLVTVDTSVAHLGGAVGTRTWVAAPTYPDFRYGLEGDGTPWYPTMRVFRRTRSGDWQGVVERMAAAAAELVAGRRG